MSGANLIGALERAMDVVVVRLPAVRSYSERRASTGFLREAAEDGIRPAMEDSAMLVATWIAPARQG